VLVTVHEKRGKDGMNAAGVLPAFGGIACHDAWAPPHDCYSGVAGHALCGAHVLRELAAVTEAGTDADVIWARQAIEALPALRRPRTGPAPQGGPRPAPRPWTSSPAGSVRQPLRGPR
jgi:transposase